MSTDRFQDHFSDNAAGYARHRLTYPPALFDHLAPLAPAQRLCWDCATGNGQAALAWAERFEQVLASDASAEQLARASAHPRVTYRCELAEQTSLDDGSVDLISVAAAIHWLELDPFYAEVRRVARPGALLAAWSYGARLQITPPVDALLGRFIDETLGPWWPERFGHVRSEYRELPFPFAELEAPELAALTDWTLDDLLGNMRTWSGVRALTAARGGDPVAELAPELARAWGVGGQQRRACAWPLFFRLGRVG